MNMMNSKSNRGKMTHQATCVCCNECYNVKMRKKIKRNIRQLEKIMWRKDWGI